MPLIWLITRCFIYIYGTMLPAYNTFKSLKQYDENITTWAKYWTVYAMLICLEPIADLVFSWMPLYQVSKLVIVISVVTAAPWANVWLYEGIIGQMLTNRENEIDYFLNNGRKFMMLGSIQYCVGLAKVLKNKLLPAVARFWHKSNDCELEMMPSAQLELYEQEDHSTTAFEQDVSRDSEEYIKTENQDAKLDTKSSLTGSKSLIKQYTDSVAAHTLKSAVLEMAAGVSSSQFQQPQFLNLKRKPIPDVPMGLPDVFVGKIANKPGKTITDVRRSKRMNKPIPPIPFGEMTDEEIAASWEVQHSSSQDLHNLKSRTNKKAEHRAAESAKM